MIEKMEPIYRQVKCSDRLPKESGFYQTNFGPRHFLVGCGRWVGCEPQFWFEAIELPSEEFFIKEVKRMTNHSLNKDWIETISLGYLTCANFILNKLKGETNGI